MSARNAGDLGSIPGLGRSPGEENGNPLQYSCLENPMDGEAWRATVHGVPKSRTRLSDFTFTFYFLKVAAESNRAQFLQHLLKNVHNIAQIFLPGEEEAGKLICRLPLLIGCFFLDALSFRLMLPLVLSILPSSYNVREDFEAKYKRCLHDV